MKKIILSTALLVLVLLNIRLYAQSEKDGVLQLTSSRLELYFSAKDGGFCGMTAGKQPIATVRKPSDSQPLWELTLLNRNNQPVRLTPDGFRRFSSQFKNHETLVMTWSGATHSAIPTLAVTAEIRLSSSDSLSYWDLKVSGLKGFALENVHYPSITGVVTSENSRLATPNWMGHLTPNPAANLASRGNKTYRLVYPGGMSMQFMTVYQPRGKGFYAACNDSQSFQKDFILRLNEKEEMVYQAASFPEYSYDNDSYTIPYQSVIGAYEGDWFTAAEIYREWALKQEWTKNARMKNGLTPRWLDSTSLWIWNRGRTHEVLDPAITMREKLGLPVSVLWHWWHRSSYDDTFPDYIPPRDGSEKFTQEVGKARQKGIHPIIYMNQLQWAKSTPSWTAENAILSAAKNRDGSTTDHVYNIFTGKSLTNMCIATDSWRNKYTSLADTVINRYKVGGIYMDQACISRMCFDPTHGHNLGGGNYWMKGSGALTEQIRGIVQADQKEQIMLSGEGVGESWLPYQDAFLALQVSMERYAGTGVEPIPLFQAVYHPYTIVYGNYSSLLKPPYDEMWPDDQRPDDALDLLDEQYNKQFRMEQARSFAWGMQPMLSNYRDKLESARKEELLFLQQLARVRSKVLKFLLRGEMMKNLDYEAPEEKIAISKLSIYAGRKDKVTHYENTYPTLYTSVWKAEDQTLGVAVSHIADTQLSLPLQIKLEEYGISKKNGNVYLVTETDRKKLSDVKKGEVNIHLTIPPRTTWFIEIEPGS